MRNEESDPASLELGGLVRIAQLSRQYEAAAEADKTVEWRVAEENTADAIEKLIEDNGYEDRITVKHVPPEG